MRKLIYLASPYTHPDPAIREQRFEAVTRHAAELQVKGLPVFSPITCTHLAVKVYGLPVDWSYWWEFNKTFMSLSKMMIILRLDGWKQSPGVAREIEYAKQNNIDIKHRDDFGDGKVVFPEMLTPMAMDEVREVLVHGEEKHAGDWEKKSWAVHGARMTAHLQGWMREGGERESGRSHLAHAICRGLMALEKDLTC